MLDADETGPGGIEIRFDGAAALVAAPLPIALAEEIAAQKGLVLRREAGPTASCRVSGLSHARFAMSILACAQAGAPRRLRRRSCR
jgi:hypothetical protein